LLFTVSVKIFFIKTRVDVLDRILQVHSLAFEFSDAQNGIVVMHQNFKECEPVMDILLLAVHMRDMVDELVYSFVCHG